MPTIDSVVSEPLTDDDSLSASEDCTSSASTEEYEKCGVMQDLLSSYAPGMCGVRQDSSLGYAAGMVASPADFMGEPRCINDRSYLDSGDVDSYAVSRLVI